MASGIQIELFAVQNTGGSRICVKLRWDLTLAWIEEPPDIGIFGRRYRSADDSDLAGALKQLDRAVRRQCATGGAEGAATKQQIYRQLLFGNS